MTHFTTLTSQKYYAQTADDQEKQLLQDRSWQSMELFATMGASLAYIAILLHCWNQLPAWVSMIQNWIV